MRRRLLLVSYYYPPLAGPGVFRPLRLSKYLPRLGWEVTVLTVRAGVRALKDPSLVAEVPPEVRVERTASVEPRTALLALLKLGLRGAVARIEPWLMLPDDQRGWCPFAVRRGKNLLRALRHDAVLTTAGPYSAHLVGLALRQAVGIPWIADFRDEWTTNPYLADRYPTRWHRRYNRMLERRVVATADRVVAVSRPWLEAIRESAGVADDGRFTVMPNGYDGEHFPAAPAPPPDRFRIVYTGTFYGHRSPTTFLEAVRRLLADGRIPREEIEVVLIGHGVAVGGHGVELPGIPDGVVRIVPQRPYLEAVAALQRAAALLLVVPRAGGAGNHTGKLFGYLASGRPILTLAPEPNVAADLVRASRSGIVVPPDDVGAVAAALERLHRAWKRGEAPNPDRSIVEAYEASRQAADWRDLLDALVDGRRRPE
jgi:glycosyltransferase involved in cell wall biosynthesis